MFWDQEMEWVRDRSRLEIEKNGLNAGFMESEGGQPGMSIGRCINRLGFEEEI